jgi:cytochrome P450
MHWWFVLSGAMKKHDRISGTVRETIMGVIRDRVKNPIDANDLLDLLLSTRYEDTGQPMSENQILDESLILFAAGHETSAVALTWTLYLLDRHPEHWDVIRKEARECTFDSMQSVMRMQYTRQVIEESMRIYPPAWMIDRLSNEDDEILGFRYPKDTFILLWLYGLHHDEDLWPDHMKFDPSRFDPDRKKAMPAYSYVPFGGGPRLCIGYQFAMLEMLQVLGYIALNYDVDVTEKQVDIKPLVTLHPKQDIAAHVRKRP